MKNAIIILILILISSNFTKGEEGEWITIDPPGAYNTIVLDIDGDKIVGYYYDYANNFHSFLYDGTTWTTFQRPGYEYANPYGFDGDKIVGKAGQPWHSFLYDGTTWKTLEAPGTATPDDTIATGIDGSNIVGMCFIGGRWDGFLYDGSNWTIFTTPWSSLGQTRTWDIDGNNIIGYYWGTSPSSSSWSWYSFLYDGTTWTSFGQGKYAEGISGDNIVGHYSSDGCEHGFLYDGTTWTTLDAPGAYETVAYGIDGDKIVGFYRVGGAGGRLHGFLYKIGTTPEPPSEPDFWIDRVRPVQVVWNSDIDGDDVNDLVEGKATAVLVDVGLSGCEGLNQEELNQVVEVQLDFGNTCLPLQSKTIAELLQDTTIEFYPDKSIITYGDKEIIAEVDPRQLISESDENNNSSDPVKVTVKETNGLYLAYFPVDGIDPDGLGPMPGIPGLGYGPLDLTSYSSTVTNSGKFVEAIYPVSKDNFVNKNLNKKYYGSPDPLLGMLWDLLGIWEWTELETGTNADRGVGIVPDNYFENHSKPNNHGVAFPFINAVLSEVNYWTVTVHEVGHTYGLEDEYTEGGYPGDPATGYWCEEQNEISYGRCFMGNVAPEESFKDSLYGNVWACEESYSSLFQEFRVNQEDPPTVLLFNGIIFKNGTVDLGSLNMVENGLVDNVIPGDYLIQMLDINGQILVNIPFQALFSMYLDPDGIVETDYTAFAFVIEYPEEASSIQIQHNGQTLAEINPNSKLLYDAISALPDHAFKSNPDQRRRVILNKIDEFEIKIEEGQILDARDKLVKDIYDKFEKWIVPNYEPENPLQLSKAELLDLIDNIIERFDTIYSEVAVLDKYSIDSAETFHTIEGYNLNNKGSEIENPEEYIISNLEKAYEIINELDFADFYDEESAYELADAVEKAILLFDNYQDVEALILLNKILQATDGCANTGQPNEDDYIITYEAQKLLYPLVLEIIEILGSNVDISIFIEEAILFKLDEAYKIINKLAFRNFIDEEAAYELADAVEYSFILFDHYKDIEALYVLCKVLQVMDGCANIGQPDDNDYIITYEAQELLYPLVLDTIELLKLLESHMN